MSNQYFENNEALKSEPIKIDFYYHSKKLSFLSDNGVFSKRSVDFGSSLLIQNISGLEDAKKALDVGCGYGVIGITLASEHKNVMFDLVDVNNRAIELAKTNATNNNLSNISVFQSDVYTNIITKYDVIISNPPIRAGKKIVHSILLDGFDYLNNNGSLWCVIQKKQGAESAIAALEKKYRKVEIIVKDNGYYIIKAIK